MNGPLWSSNIRMARTLAATMPSGDAPIVALRREISAFFSVPDSMSMLPAVWETSVYNATSIERPWPAHYIYVGHGPDGSGFNPSPWGSPFTSTAVAVECAYDTRFILYARNKADVKYWLQPLVGS